MTSIELHNMLELKSIQSCCEFMKILTDCYFDIIHSQGNKTVNSRRLNDARIWFQMMFSKGVHFTKSLEGIDYNKGSNTLNRITDHTILFSQVRDMYESYVAFKLLFTLPKTEIHRDLIYNLFIHAGQQERFINASVEYSDDLRWKEIQKEIEDCKKRIYANELYVNNPEIHKVVDNALSPKSNKYRYYFTDDGRMEFVSYEKGETLKLLGINSSVFEGMYHFFSMMSHPSYVALEQFSVAYQNPEEGSIMLAASATRYSLSIFSLFIIEYEILFPEVKIYISEQPELIRRLVYLYANMVIKDAAKHK